MNSDQTNIDDLFDDFDIEMNEFSEQETALLAELSEDPDISVSDELDDETKKKLVESTIIVPDGEDDFVNKIGDDEDNVESDADDGDGSHDADSGNSSDDQDDSSTYFKAVAEGLNKLGKFGGDELPEKFDTKSFLEFYDKFTENKISAGIEDKISDKWGDEGIKIFNDIFVNGVDPREYFGKYNEILDLKSLDLEKEVNQKLVISAYLEALGQDEEEILDQIEVLEDKGKLAERSEKYREKLIEDQNRELSRIATDKENQVIEARKAQLVRMTAIKEVASKALEAKEINGIPLNVNDSKELVPYATELNWKLANGTLITDADKAILEIKRDPSKWLALCKLLKEDLNITPIKTKGAEEKADEVFNFKTKKTVRAPVRDTLDLFLKKGKF